MRLKKLGFFCVIVFVLLFGGAAFSFAAAQEAAAQPSPHVQDLIDKYKLEIVNYDYVVQKIGNGTRSGASAVLVDARPNAKYIKGTIPTSINIPDTEIEKYIGQLDDVAKDKEIIVFCGGWKCEKSPIVGGYLKEHGFSNVKLYQAGDPDWARNGYEEVGLAVVKAAVEKDSALLMDARPHKKFLAETIPGSLGMSDTELDRLSGRFPVDKSTPVIAFCGGYSCDKSHIVAKKMKAEGYSNVKVFAAGLPAWKNEGLPTTAGAGKMVSATTVPAKDAFVDGVKVGGDEGTVDGEWLNALIKSNNIPENVQLIDVRPSVDFAAGHMPGSVNIEAAQLSADELAGKLPAGKVAVFTCGSGARAMEAFLKLQEAGKDVSKVMYFDANISCDKDNMCAIEVNEPLG